MPIPHYLAMTAAEITENFSETPRTAWMACHFSPYGTGLSNLPRWLPPESLLILNDRTPIHDHDPVLVAAQLGDCAARLQCTGVLLDFQRPDDPQTRELTRYLCQALPCPVAVSEPYADGQSDAVFLPPPPEDEALTAYLAPWCGREIWLEMALDGQEIILTEAGAQVCPLPLWEHPAGGFREERLHCHYRSALSENSATFTLWRTTEDLDALLVEAEQLGVTAAVGLYQQLRHWKTPSRWEGAE